MSVPCVKNTTIVIGWGCWDEGEDQSLSHFSIWLLRVILKQRSSSNDFVHSAVVLDGARRDFSSRAFALVLFIRFCHCRGFREGWHSVQKQLYPSVGAQGAWYIRPCLTCWVSDRLLVNMDHTGCPHPSRVCIVPQIFTKYMYIPVSACVTDLHSVHGIRMEESRVLSTSPIIEHGPLRTIINGQDSPL